MCMRKVNPTWWPNVTITIVRQNPVRPKSTTSNQRKTIEKSQVGIFLPPSPSRTLHVSPISCNNCYFRFYFLFFFIIINTSSQRTTPPCTRTHHIIYLHHVFDVCSFYNSCVSSCCILYRIFCTTKSNVFAHRKLDRIAHCKSDAKKTPDRYCTRNSIDHLIQIDKLIVLILNVRWIDGFGFVYGSHWKKT